MTRDHLLRVRLSALAGSAVHRMMAAKGSSRSDTFNRCKRRARRARSISRPSAVHSDEALLFWGCEPAIAFRDELASKAGKQ
jgi:hypothetical protein